MKKTICKIAAFITTIIFYWGLLLEYSTNSYGRKDRWYWPDLKEIREVGCVFFMGLMCQAFFVLLLCAFIQHPIILLWLFAIIGGIGLLGLLLFGAIRCVNENSKDDKAD